MVSNPPFVITRVAGGSAEEQFTYRDGGLPSDEIVARWCVSCPRFWCPVARAQMLGNWEIIRDSADPSQPHPWDERVRAWVEEAGAEAWIIQRETLSPESLRRDLAEGCEREPRPQALRTDLAWPT